MKDFFISYTEADRNWAEWIAWQLEEAGYAVVVQAWDFAPGENFVLKMDQASAEATRTLAVLSPDYLDSLNTQSEWAAAFAQDPSGATRKLIPVRVRKCDLKGRLLGQTIYVDLLGLKENEAEQALLAGVQQERMKPSSEPNFPGSEASPHKVVVEKPTFPTTKATIAPAPAKRPADGSGPPRKAAQQPRWAWWAIGILIPLLAVFAPLVWTEFAGDAAQQIDRYRVRVTMLDPQGTPVNDVTLWSDLGRSELRAVEGGWEFDVAAEDVPQDARLTLHAAKEEDYLVGQQEVAFGNEALVVVTIELERDRSARIRGDVADSSGGPIEGARVSVEGFGNEAALTGADGHFDLPAHAAAGETVRLQVEHANFPASEFSTRFYRNAGDDPVADLTLLRRQ